MELKIAVISDLHCHSKSKNKGLQESYLLTDQPIPDNQNPLKSLNHLISLESRKGSPIQADILIMPGDISNRCEPSGFNFGWDVVKEVCKLFQAKIIIPTIGNHDVDSRQTYSSNPIHPVSTFATDFPFLTSAQNSKFWSEGYIFIESEEYRILVVNSAHNHRTVAEAEHGSISQDLLNELEEELKQKSPKQFNIAICHHHPIPHERHHLGTADLIYNGTQFVELLGQYNYQIIIHGHKHDPLIRYAPGGTTSPVIFSAGSFSAYKSLLLSGAYNTFHLITLESDEKAECENQGIIDTWFFTPSKGWDKNVQNEYFLSKIGFGCRTSLKQLTKSIKDWMHNQREDNFTWADFIPNFEMINYLLPVDRKALGSKLKSEGINVYPYFPTDPEVISLKRDNHGK